MMIILRKLPTSGPRRTVEELIIEQGVADTSRLEVVEGIAREAWVDDDEFNEFVKGIQDRRNAET